MAQYPMHDKLLAIQKESQAIGEFLDWLREKEIYLSVFDEYESEYAPVFPVTEKLLAEYFSIDLELLENEKQRMLERQRELNRAMEDNSERGLD